MPIYEYQCDECGERLEVLQRLNDPPLTEHEGCGGAVRKLISAPAFQFKGSGWYVTDYARSNGGDGKSTEKAETKSEGKEGASQGEGAKPEKADKADTSSAAKKSTSPAASA